MATKGNYVHNYGKIFGGILNTLILCNFLKTVMVSDKTIHKAFRTHCINEIPFQFHYLPKLYIGFNFEVKGEVQ